MLSPTTLIKADLSKNMTKVDNNLTKQHM